MQTKVFAVMAALAITPTHAADTSDAAATDRDPNRWPQIESAVKPDEKIEAAITKIIGRMTLDEKVGQLAQAEIQSISPQDVKKYHIGSILNGGGSYPGLKKDARPIEWLALAEEYYKASVDKEDGRIGIPIIWGTDAVHGHNNVLGATLYPHNIGLGAAHDPDLIEKIGAATARVIRVTGINWTFAPTLAVARDDRWGRTYESYSEDPALIKLYGDRMVRGLQGDPRTGSFMQADRVVATAKHFLADGGTTNGKDQGDTQLSEEDLIALHAAGYESALAEGAQTVMASFSSWNGEKMHGHKYMLTDILKGRMGFDGFVVGDWNGHAQLPGCTEESCAAAINAGMDMIMVPTNWKGFIFNTKKQVKSGKISMERLEDAVRRILRVKIRAGLFGRVKPSETPLAGRDALIGHEIHRTIAQEAVRKSLVLLKNEGGALPVKKGAKVLVAGPGADNIPMQAGGWSLTWQGRDTKNDDFPGATSIWSGLKAAVEAAGGTPVLSASGSYSETPDVAILVYGETPYAEFEGDLPDGVIYEDKAMLGLMAKLKADGVTVVSVFLSGRPRHVGPLMDHSDAFVAAWFPGTEGQGVADVLVAGSGDAQYDFTGTLSFSWPKTSDAHPINAGDTDYDPLFPLGYGLTMAGQ